jgi:adenylylsulfate kinase-like enzyme
MTGISSPYEPPAEARITIRKNNAGVEASVAIILKALYDDPGP